MRPWLGLGLFLAATATASDALELECPLDTIAQEFRWTRDFPGIPEPVEWSVRREIEFLVDGEIVRGRESLRLALPEFRWRFQQYMTSAKVESCETLFYVQARTPSATSNSLSMPLVIDYQEANCKGFNPDCVESADLIGECHRQDREVTTDLSAELDVTYLFGFQLQEMRPEVHSQSQPIYGELDHPTAQALFKQVVEAGAGALQLVSGTLGEVSLARLAPDLQPVDIEGGFVDAGGSEFELFGHYSLSPRQLCRARLAIESFGQRHRPAAP